MRRPKTGCSVTSIGRVYHATLAIFAEAVTSVNELAKVLRVFRAPLHSLPLMSEPFCQVAVDIVGPLPVCKDSGNRFILTVLDLCTHYPEAIALKQHTASNVAQALSTVFSRFGFPQEILSHQGTDFMFELMQIFCTTSALTISGPVHTIHSPMVPVNVSTGL